MARVAVGVTRQAKSVPTGVAPATAEELTHRLIFLMVNEAARCVEEGVVDSPEDADYGMILGTGFAPFRGGPLRFAEHFGIKRTVEELERLARTEKKFTPCEILKKHARDGTKFYEDVKIGILPVGRRHLAAIAKFEALFHWQHAGDALRG